MSQSEADGRFAAASQLYVDGMYEDALVILSELDAEFPGEQNLLKAKARTLAKLGHFQDAIEICDRLESELGYSKAGAFRKTLVSKSRKKSAAIELSFNPETVGNDNEAAVEMEAIGASGESAAGRRRFRIKPVRLGALLLIAAGMYFGYVPYWLGGGLIVAYFAIKYAIARAFFWLFSLPFKMKGKALAGATVELHGYEWTGKPETDSHDDDEPAHAQPMRYAWIDVTISPPVRTQGFSHWEPGELMIAPATTKVRNLDDMDKCFRIHELKYIVDGQVIDDEGNKVNGPHRLKLLAEFPANATNMKFVYYGYSFGDIALAQP